jgi:hypothetical protein
LHPPNRDQHDVIAQKRLELDERKQKLEALAVFTKAKKDGDTDTMNMLCDMFPEWKKYSGAPSQE